MVGVNIEANQLTSLGKMISNDILELKLEISGKYGYTGIEDITKTLNLNFTADGNFSSNFSKNIILSMNANKMEKTGKYNEWKTKNIYDLAGNAYEWTTEMKNNLYISRGGQYCSIGADEGINYRNETSKEEKYGYRTILYLK